jgi:L-lactate dehydrogenase complex protein LldG
VNGDATRGASGVESSKAAILRAIRSALADVPDGEKPEDVAVSREYFDSHIAPGTDAVDVFAERCADYRATVTRCSETEAAATVARILGERGLKALVVPSGFPAEWLTDAGADIERITDDPVLTSAQLDAADGVITTAAAAIALTGTIILDAGPGQGRRALSLVPDYHLCVIRTGQIVDDVPGAVRAMDPVRPTTLISGPSATSDIELDRVEGVHGPRTLDVLLVG